MRNAVLKVGLLFGVFIIITTGNASALSVSQLSMTDDPFDYKNIEVEKNEKPNKKKDSSEKPVTVVPPEEEPVEPATIEIIQHTVQPGESLTSIAELHNIEWTRIYDKNIEIENPDTIAVGEVFTIPATDEVLEKRVPPAPVVVLPTNQPVAQPTSVNSSAFVPTPQPRGAVAGNTYAAGYCTWYAKNRRPDLPNNLGNADTWVVRAASQGYATGSTPRVGAIGQQGMHVVYVEAVNGDGTVFISEMNAQGLFVTSSRTAPASNFMYIY